MPVSDPAPASVAYHMSIFAYQYAGSAATTETRALKQNESLIQIQKKQP